jgi:hypothetical protein
VVLSHALTPTVFEDDSAQSFSGLEVGWMNALVARWKGLREGVLFGGED